ncbi:MAG: nicotinate-nucleotide--dimethylbenzimidazole phosphoribosyltransferase, partial [Atopobiaceae bacterium]|nr:nicotinate-nucleotide--dimethylbenzimidazole phosphoribosyltransferase [Atopobiaceae bacterium]
MPNARSASACDSQILNLRIPPFDHAVADAARTRWNSVAKPIGSLGLLEDAVTQIALVTGDLDVDISRRCVAVLCADNGVVAEGVSQSTHEVTTTVANNIARGRSSVCLMCRPFGIDCMAVDLGMVCPPGADGVLDRRIAAGTGNIAQGPAMTREQAARAIMVGVDLVEDLKRQGYGIIATGEMGIGNTTTATAMACAFLEGDPKALTARGAGLSDEGLRRKEEAIARALEINRPLADDPLDVLSKVGGFDIAGMCGMFLGGAVHRVPVIVDGLISVVAAFCAWRLKPECVNAMIASHVSSEPAAGLMLDQMGLRAPLHAGMRLGEGTGAASLIPLLDMAVSL